MSHHLTKLHKKALAAGTTSSLAQSHSSMSMAGDLMTSGGFTDVHASASATMEDAAGRRMSDPVRPLDRNYGVNGSMSRHRSYGNLQGGNRQPVHGAMVRGQETLAGGQQYQQAMYGMRQQQHYNPRAYSGQQFQAQGQWGPGMNGYAGVGQQQGAMPPYQATGFQGGYGQQPAAAGSASQAAFSQQQWSQQQQAQYGQQQTWNQQQQMGWDQGQWTAQQQQQQQANWANGAPSPRTSATPANAPMYPMAGQQQGMPTKQEAKRTEGSKAPPTGEGMQPEAYQRTLEYVQQCQSWSSTSVVSPDSSSVPGAKQKQSPGHPGADAQAMPPPAAMGSGAPLAQMAPQSGAMTPRHAPGGAAATPVMGEAPKQAQDSSSNMVIADMSSSMNALMEENR